MWWYRQVRREGELLMARHLLSIAAAVAGLTLTGPAVAAGLHDVPAPSDAPETLTAIIEIPAGTDVKYEIDADGRIFVDRFMALPVVYRSEDHTSEPPVTNAHPVC